MNLKTSSRAVIPRCALACLLALSTPAWATDVIPDWSATTGLPTATSPPWAQTGSDATQAAGVLTISTASAAENTYYLQDTTANPSFSTLAGASIEARVRYVSGAAASSARDAAVVALTHGGGWGNALFVGNGVIFIGAGENTRGASAVIDTSVFHTYRIDLGAGGIGAATFNVYVDDVAALTGSTYNSGLDNGSAQLVFWGEASAVAYGTSQWQFVRDAAPVPEPASGALFAAGLLATGAWLRGRRARRALLAAAPAFAAGLTATSGF